MLIPNLFICFIEKLFLSENLCYWTALYTIVSQLCDWEGASKRGLVIAHSSKCSCPDATIN